MTTRTKCIWINRMLVTLLICAFAPSIVAATSDREIIAFINKVTVRLAGGDIASLDDLKSLPGDSAVAALMMYYRQNKYVYKSTPKSRLITEKISQLLPEITGADAYLKDLFKKRDEANVPNGIFRQRAAAIACLAQGRSNFAIRILAESLTDNDGTLGLAEGLADMNIEGAPYSQTNRKDGGTPQGVAKWKEWWEINKRRYVNGK